jgi:UDP-glucose 4-epimerase
MARLIEECDIVYHLAAAVGVRYIMENRLRAFEVGVGGTQTVLKLANREKKKVMLASTSEVYGRNGNPPYREDAERVMGPTTVHRWVYACTKALDEFLALAYWEEEGLPVVIMRFFNTVGPRQVGRYGMVIPRFVSSALRHAPLTVYGDGSQTRCFTYVEDAVRAVMALAECPTAAGEIFNIGSAQEVSINELAERVILLTNSRSTITHIPYEAAFGRGFEDMKRRAPDISKIERFVGWKPEVGLDGILTRVINYARSGPLEVD